MPPARCARVCVGRYAPWPQVTPHALNAEMLTWLRLVLASADEVDDAETWEDFKRGRSPRTEASALNALLVAVRYRRSKLGPLAFPETVADVLTSIPRSSSSTVRWARLSTLWRRTR